MILTNVTAATVGSYYCTIQDSYDSLRSRSARVELTLEIRVTVGVSGLPTLEWSEPGVRVEQAEFPEGPWGSVEGAISPFQMPLEGNARFYRLVQDASPPKT